MKKSEVKFSFILPIHNGELYLRDCLTSLLKQKYHNYDIIIIINKCSDNTVSIIEEYKNYTDKIKVYYSNSSKVGMARNLGIKKSDGDYFICVDSDDIVEDTMLINLAKIANKNKYDLIRFNATTNHINKELFYFEKKSKQYSNIEYLNVVIGDYIEKDKISGPMWLYAINKKYFFINNFKFANRLQEDYGIFLYLIYNANSIYYLNKNLYFYRINQNGIMLKADNQINKIIDVIYFSKKYLDFFKGTQVYESVEKYIIKVLISKYKKLNSNTKKVFLVLLKEGGLVELQAFFDYPNI